MSFFPIYDAKVLTPALGVGILITPTEKIKSNKVRWIFPSNFNAKPI